MKNIKLILYYIIIRNYSKNRLKNSNYSYSLINIYLLLILIRNNFYMKMKIWGIFFCSIYILFLRVKQYIFRWSSKILNFSSLPQSLNATIHIT